MADSLQEYKPQEENEKVDKIKEESSDKFKVSESKRDEEHKEDDKIKQVAGDEEHKIAGKETEKPSITETAAGGSEQQQEDQKGFKEKVIKETAAGENKNDAGEEANYVDAKSHGGDGDRKGEAAGDDAPPLHKGLVDSIKEKLPIDGKKDDEEAEKPAASAEVDYGGKEVKGLVGKMKEKITGATQPEAAVGGDEDDNEGDKEEHINI